MNPCSINSVHWINEIKHNCDKRFEENCCNRSPTPNFNIKVEDIEVGTNDSKIVTDNFRSEVLIKYFSEDDTVGASNSCIVSGRLVGGVEAVLAPCVACVVASVVVAAGAQRSPLGWAMGGTQRLAAVAAISHAKHYYNRTHEDDTQPYEPVQFNVNVFFASATMCGVVLAVCLACWRRAVDTGKPDPDTAHSDIYTVSADPHNVYQSEPLAVTAGPPPAYDVVVDKPPDRLKSTDDALESVVTEPCPRCHAPPLASGTRSDSGLPSYEAAVLLRDTKL